MKTASRKPLRTHAQFKEAVIRWAKRLSIQPNQIRLQNMKRKWASCSTSGCICFSTDLLREKQDFQEYVIVHELLHLQVPNHGKLFKSLLNVYLPEWEFIVNRRKKVLEREL